MKIQTKQLNVSIPESVYRFVTGQAKLSGLSIKDFVEQALLIHGQKCERERLKNFPDQAAELRKIMGETGNE